MKLPVLSLVLTAAMLLGRPAAADEVTLADTGRTLVAELTLAPGKKLADGVVLMTHGTLAHKDMEIIKALRDLLQERGVSTLAITLSLGVDKRRGMYDCAVPHAHRHQDAVAEIGRWLGWLKGQGAGPVVLFGHSRGGNQTAWFAAEHDDPAIKSVVLLAPATWSPGREAKDYKARYQADLPPRLEKAQALVKAGKGGGMMEGTDFLYCPKSTVSAAAFADYYAADERHDTPSLLSRIAKPVLVIAGSKDEVVTDLPEKMKGKESATVEFALIDGADHFFSDLFAEDVADAIAGFVKE